jgi:hypothetical protein
MFLLPDGPGIAPDHVCGWGTGSGQESYGTVVVVEHPYLAHAQHLSGGRGSAATAYLRPSNLGLQAERWQQSVVVAAAAAAGTTASHILRAGIKEMGYPATLLPWY